MNVSGGTGIGNGSGRRPPPGPPYDLPTTTPPDYLHEYFNADGILAFLVARWEAVNGHDRKRFCPYSWDGKEWVAKLFVTGPHRPLYNLPRLLTHTGPILVVEGEKTCAAAQKLAPHDWLVTCWSGGANAIKFTDWTPLEGRQVVIWPDHDLKQSPKGHAHAGVIMPAHEQPGYVAAAQIKQRLPQAQIIVLPLGFTDVDGWDLADPLPDGYAPDWIQKKILAAIGEPESEPGESSESSQDNAEQPSFFDPINWQDVEVPVRRWLVPGLIPWHVPTMLSGMGGLGKTLLGLQIGHAAATGQKWIGREVTPVKVFGVFCEDDKDELHRRLHDINVNTLTDFGDLENFRLMIRDGLPACLMDFDGPFGSGTESEFFHTLVQAVKDFGAQLIILDSLYNFFHGNENNRVQVAQFVYCLKRIAKECDASLLFLAHPSKSGISSGEGYAGSTAWHDAVRSRLYLTEEGGENDEPKRLVLNTMKANYAPKDGQIEVYYQGGMLWPRNSATHSDPVYQQVQVDDAFLLCLREVAASGRRVTDSKYGRYAPKVFAKMKSHNRNFSEKDFERCMHRLYDEKRIRTGEVLDAHRKRHEGIVEVILEPVSNEI